MRSSLIQYLEMAATELTSSEWRNGGVDDR
jgi:hypothetical protein